MSKIITYHNVLAPHARSIKRVKRVKSSKDVLKMLAIDEGLFDVVLSKNSVIQEGEFKIDRGDIINVLIIPKGGGGGVKKVFAIVAMVAITIATAGAGSALAGAMGFAAGTMGAMAVQAVVGVVGAMVGGLVMQAIAPKPNFNAPSGAIGQEFDTSPSYGWAIASNQTRQSSPVPKVFGTHKITPPLIASYIDVSGDKQYLNCLYALNDGEIKSISDIKINGDDIDRFESVSHEVRYGGLSQTIVSNFNDTTYDRPIGKALSTNYINASTEGNSVSGIGVTLAFPNGIFYANDEGGLSSYSVSVRVEYSRDERSWITLADTQISAAQTSALRRTFKKVGLPPARYYVRVKFNHAPSSSNRYGSKGYFEFLSESVSDDFTYPRTALLAIRALATDQLNGSMPRITCLVSAGSQNPATIAKQILTDCGVSADRILPSFDEWERFCVKHSHEANIVFDTNISVRKALDTVGVLGRASVVQVGSRFDALIERGDLLPTQSFMFGMGNILNGTFKQHFLPLVDRASGVEITYYDRDKDYEPTQILIGDDPKGEQLPNKASIKLIGCTSKAQAMRYGQFLLNCNRYLTQTVEFEASIDSLVCRYGDVIKVSHDVPAFGTSGRLAEDSIDGVLTLDVDVELNPDKQYMIAIKDELNNAYEFSVTAKIAPFKIAAQLQGRMFKKYDIYSFGEVGKASKLYRVVKISTSSELTRLISAIEYIPEVYAEALDIPVESSASLGISNLRADDFLLYEKGEVKTALSLNWRGNALAYNVGVRKAGEREFKFSRVFNNYFQTIVEDGVVYEAIVKDDLGRSQSINREIVGKLAPPPPIRALNIRQTRDEWLLSWEYPDPPLDFKEFCLYEGGELIATTQANSTRIAKTTLSRQIQIIAKDTSRISSEALTASLQADLPPNITGLASVYANGTTKAAWDAKERMSYEVRRGQSWESGGVVYTGDAPNCELNFLGRYMFKCFYINSSGLRLESAQEASLNLAENLLPTNVMKKVSYSAAKNNWTQNSWFPRGSAASVRDKMLVIAGDYDNADFSKRKTSSNYAWLCLNAVVTLSKPKLCKLSSFVDFTAMRLSDAFDLHKNVDTVVNIDTGGAIANVACDIYFSPSQDGTNFTKNFIPFKNGEYIGKAFKFALRLYTKDTAFTPVVSSWDIIIDMPDIIESGSGKTSASGAIGVLYDNDFSAPPKVQVTLLNAQKSERLAITNQTTRGFEIAVHAGADDTKPVARDFNYIVKGY